MNKVKSIGFTAVISILFVGVLHIIPINKKQREKDELAKNVSIEEELEFRDSLAQNISLDPPMVDEVQNVQSLPPQPSETPKKQEVPVEKPAEPVKEEVAVSKEPAANEEVLIVESTELLGINSIVVGLGCNNPNTIIANIGISLPIVAAV